MTETVLITPQMAEATATAIAHRVAMREADAVNGVHLAALIILAVSVIYLPWERLWRK